MSAKGYRGGYNPFRKGGKFATAQSADHSSDAGAAEAANGLGVKNETIGATGHAEINAAIRAAAGAPRMDAGRGSPDRADAGGGSSSSMTADQLYGTSIFGGNQGSGRASIEQTTADGYDVVAAFGRGPARGKSPEQPFTQPKLSEETRRLLGGDPDDREPGSLGDVLSNGPRDLVETMGFLGFEGKVDAAVGILRDNGFVPAKATIKDIDDLIATRFESETADQKAMRVLRIMGMGIAARVDSPENIVSQWGDNTSPAQDESFMWVAAQAGQTDHPNFKYYRN